MPSEREDEEMVAALIDAAGDAATALAYDADTVAMEAAVQKATDALVDRLAQYRARVARLEGALDGDLWSFCRRLLEQGRAIEQDNQAGRYPTYEHLSARLDEAARERAEQFRAALAPAAARKEGV